MTYRGFPVVPAVIIQAVVDEVITVDHAAVLEPLPLRLGDVEVVLLVLRRHAVGQRGGHRQVQLVGDGIGVRLRSVPVDAATS